MNGPKVDLRRPWAAPGSPEHAAWDIAQVAEANEREAREREDRARARQLFIDAGKPVPSWCAEPEPTRPSIDASAAIEADDELLDRGRT
ncbi:hypothetical protein [Sandaracinus amylolyticus]|uniref:hypothetical protein n=1 Tax=Sandaracinus amylolyticus TaxID=927083 RepID=UPI001F1767FC|nr:hypothetical protein [Sandaracinus amylolyticus]UJR81445.1 Hypothetical protein I5071_35040 [Sandaracinus amylolyticus]